MKKLTDANIVDLKNFIENIPTKYGLTLLQFIEGLEDIKEPKKK